MKTFTTLLSFALLASTSTSAQAEELREVRHTDCSAEPAGEQVAQATSIATQWNSITSEYVTSDGGFRYAALAANEAHNALLDQLVAQVASASTSELTDPERLVFLINAYNILVVDDMLVLWPVESVLSEDGFFDGRTHTVAGAEMTLNALENEHIRGFGDPRIHFAVNCASDSCPPLLADAFTVANYEELANTAAQAYVRATARVDREAGAIAVSQIFEWFAGDFSEEAGVREFVASHLADAADAAIARTGAISYWPYDWSTNAR
ncbi:MAG: hypothetical protein ACI81R_002033 [Bradymonadia bacterium]|jgi:hypothetical protein